VEIDNKLQSVEEVQQCQRMSEARVSQADIAIQLVEHKQGVENSPSMFRIELIEIMEGMTTENRALIKEKLDSASSDNSAKLGKLDDRMELLEEKQLLWQELLS